MSNDRAVNNDDEDAASDEAATPDGDQFESPPPGTEAVELGTDPGDESRSAVSGVRRHLVAIVLAAALVLSGALTGWLYLSQYRPDQQTDAAARETALEAAKTGTVALLSYSPDTLDENFTTAKSHLTGEFLDYYTEFTQQVVAPAATQKSVNTEAKVILGAVSDLRPGAAEVLLFINQTTTSQENPDGAFAASSVKVGLQKVDGNWLIASFDPV